MYIISCDLLKRNIAELSAKDFFYVILDEAQYIKNADARQRRNPAKRDSIFIS